MSGNRQIVVTGIGVVTACGGDRETFWQSLTSGTTGIAPIDPPQPLISFPNVAACSDFDPEARFDVRMHRKLDRSAQFGLAAADEAIAHSGIEWDDNLRGRTGVIAGCSIGGSHTQDLCYERLYKLNKVRSEPMAVPNIMPSASTSQISMKYGFRGPSFTMTTACASSGHALGMALWMLRTGQLDVAVSGGHEAMLNLGSLLAWDGLRVVSSSVCKPFADKRPGMVLGEGGAMLVLETLESARARGATIYAELAGFGMNADAHHLTAPSLEGPTGAIQAALADAGLAPTDIEYINAHGTGTSGNDMNEIAAIKSAFGDHAHKLAISSTKSMHGHTIGAAGGIEAAATVLALHHGVLPPTINSSPLDPACDLDVIPDVARKQDISAALSNSFAFGGLNAVLAFKKA
jgi:nodulation protein E